MMEIGWLLVFFFFLFLLFLFSCKKTIFNFSAKWQFLYTIRIFLLVIHIFMCMIPGKKFENLWPMVISFFLCRYPLDSPVEGFDSVKGSTTEDDDLFHDMANQYSLAHPSMHTGEGCNGQGVSGGITRGSSWHRMSNTFQDYVYLAYNSFMVRLLLYREELKKEDTVWGNNMWHIISKGTLGVPLTKSRFQHGFGEENLSFIKWYLVRENWTNNLEDIVQKSTFFIIIFIVFLPSYFMHISIWALPTLGTFWYDESHIKKWLTAF